MAEGPSTQQKIRAAISDRSYLVDETWARLGRNFIIVTLVSISVWAFCSILRWCVETSTDHLFQSAPWVLMSVLLAGGIIRGILFQFPSWKRSQGDGAGESIEYFLKTYQDEKHAGDAAKNRYAKPTFMRAIRRIILTILTVGTGGSGGIEGPVIPIGESLGSGWSKFFRIFDPDDLRAVQMAGIAAAIATLLNAPLTAAIFSAEIVLTDKIIYRTLLYSLIAAIVAFALNNHFLHFPPLFSTNMHPPIYSPGEYLEVTLVAIFCSAPAGLGVRYIFKQLKTLFEPIPSYARATVGALCVGIIAMSLWFGLNISPEHILGIGEKTMKHVLDGTAGPLMTIWWILLVIVVAKTFTTGLTLMSGGSAGLLIPAMFLGGMTGASVYHLLQTLHIHTFSSSPQLFFIAGIASSLVAVIEVPIAAITFIMEAFGASFGAPAIVACVVCHMLAKRLRLYASSNNASKG